jgi:hypothetical protein
MVFRVHCLARGSFPTSATNMNRASSLLTVLVVSASLASSPDASAQGNAPDVLERVAAPAAAGGRQHPAVMRAERARVRPDALASNRVTLLLFDDVKVVARRTSSSHTRPGSTVWLGTLDAPSQGSVTLALVDGVLAGSVTADGRMFEIAYAGDGLHDVREVSPALFPTEDPPMPPMDLISSSGSGSVSSTSSAAGADAAGQVDVMVVWTPAARTAVGGTAAAIQSLVDLAIANANVSYANSQIAATLRLVYSGEVSFAESTISNDLSRLAGTADGSIDQVHVLRDQYGADVVSLIGSGYASGGTCGIGYLMQSVSTGFASYAFNVVDQSCAGGYLSYAHEVGHNQGLHHDPANASGTPSYPYAYGYQEVSGAFRTVMSYGSAARVQHFSNPNVLYGGRPTGTSTQDNARALNGTAATVANFRTSSSQTTCSYTVSPTSMAFSETGGTATVSVATTSGCTWTTSSGTSWVSVGPGGSGPGSVAVDVAANPGSQRSGTATVAGRTIAISEQGTPTCAYTVTPTSVSFTADGGTALVNVSAATGCTWSASSDASWLTVGRTASGSGSVALTAAANTSRGSRSASAMVAGQAVAVSQSGAAKVRGPKR